MELDHNVRNTYENIKILLSRKECKNVEMLGKSLKILGGIVFEHSDNKRAKDAADFVRAELAKLKK